MTCVDEMPFSVSEAGTVAGPSASQTQPQGQKALSTQPGALPPLMDAAEGLAQAMLKQLTVVDQAEPSRETLAWKKFDKCFLQTPLTLKDADGQRRLTVTIAGLLRALGTAQLRLRGSTVNHWEELSPQRDIDLAVDWTGCGLEDLPREVEPKIAAYLESCGNGGAGPSANQASMQQRRPKKASNKAASNVSKALSERKLKKQDEKAFNAPGIPVASGRALMEHFTLARRVVDGPHSAFYKLQLGHKHADSHQIDLLVAQKLGVSFDVVHASSELHINTQRKQVSVHHLYPASLLAWLDRNQLLWFHPQVQGGLARLNIKCTKGPQVYLLQEDLLPHLIEAASHENGANGRSNALQQFAYTVLNHVGRMPAAKQLAFWRLVLRSLDAQTGVDSLAVRQQVMDWSRLLTDRSNKPDYENSGWGGFLSDMLSEPLTEQTSQRIGKLSQGLAVGHDFQSAMGRWWANNPEIKSLIESYFKEAHCVSLPSAGVLLDCLRDLPLGLDVRSALCTQVLIPCIQSVLIQAGCDLSMVNPQPPQVLTQPGHLDQLHGIYRQLCNPEHHECVDALQMAVDNPSKASVDKWAKAFQGLIDQGRVDLCVDMLRKLKPFPLNEKLLLEMSTQLAAVDEGLMESHLIPDQDEQLKGLIQVCQGLQEASGCLSGRTPSTSSAKLFFTAWLDVVSRCPFASHLLQNIEGRDGVCLSAFHIMFGAEGEVLIAKPGVEGMYKGGLLYLGDTVLKSTNFNSDWVPYGRFSLKSNGYPRVECERKCASDPFQIKTQWSVGEINSNAAVPFFAQLVELLAPLNLGDPDETGKIKFELQAESRGMQFYPSPDGFESLLLNLCNEGTIEYAYPGKLEKACLTIRNSRPDHVVLTHYREYEMATLHVPYPKGDGEGFLNSVSIPLLAFEDARLSTTSPLTGEVEKQIIGPYNFEMGAVYGPAVLDSKRHGFTYRGLALDMYILGDGVLEFHATGNSLNVPQLTTSASLRLAFIKAMVQIDKASPHLLRQTDCVGLWNDSRKLPPADFRGFVNQEGDIYHLMAFKSGAYLLGFLRQKGIADVHEWVELTGRFYWIDRSLGPVMDVEILENLKLQLLRFEVSPKLMVLPHGPHSYCPLDEQGEPRSGVFQRNYSSYLGYELPDHPALHSQVRREQLLEHKSGQFKLCMGLSVPQDGGRQSHHLEMNLDSEAGYSDLEITFTSKDLHVEPRTVLHSPEVVGVQLFMGGVNGDGAN